MWKIKHINVITIPKYQLKLGSRPDPEVIDSVFYHFLSLIALLSYYWVQQWQWLSQHPIISPSCKSPPPQVNVWSTVYMTSHTCSWGGPTPEGTASVRSLLLYQAWLLANCSEGWSWKLLSTHMVPPGKCHQFLKSPRRMWTNINNLCPKLKWHSVSPFEWKQVCLMLWEAFRAVYWGFWARSYLHHFSPEGLC